MTFKDYKEVVTDTFVQ